MDNVIKIYIVGRPTPLVIAHEGTDVDGSHWVCEIEWKDNLMIAKRLYAITHETMMLYVAPRHHIQYIDMGNDI